MFEGLLRNNKVEKRYLLQAVNSGYLYYILKFGKFTRNLLRFKRKDTLTYKLNFLGPHEAYSFQKVKKQDFTGGTVDKNPPCSRHGFDPWSGEKTPHTEEQLSPVPKLLSLCAIAGAATTEAYVPRPCALQPEKAAATRSPCTTVRESAPSCLQLEKSTHSNEGPEQLNK